MADNQDSKKIQNGQEQEVAPTSQTFLSPSAKPPQAQGQEQGGEGEQTYLILSDLSPMIPKYSSNSVLSTYPRYGASDMTIIETPANNLMRASYLEQIDENMKSISGVITWTHEEESQPEVD